MIRIAPLSLVFALALVACGSGAAPSAAPASSAAPAASKPAAASASGVASDKPAAGSAASVKPAASPSAAGGAKEKLSVAYTSFTMDQLSAMVAKEQGFFDQNGLDVEVTSIGAGSRPETALIAGQLQAYEGGPEVIAASVGGADLEFVAAPDPDFNFWLYGAPNIKTADDLKGKRIAVTSLTSSTYTAARIGVRSLGLDPDKDVSYVAANNPPAIFAALQNGAAQAGSIGSSNIIQARKSNFNMLADISAMNVHYPAGWWAVSKKWADSHDATMQRIMKSVVQGVAYMIQEPEGTQKVLQKYSKSDDQDFLKGNYDLVKPHLKKMPLVPLDGIKLVLEEQSTNEPKAKTADPNVMLDNKWVQQLDSSGFINSLYK